MNYVKHDKIEILKFIKVLQILLDVLINQICFIINFFNNFG